MEENNQFSLPPEEAADSAPFAKSDFGSFAAPSSPESPPPPFSPYPYPTAAFATAAPLPPYDAVRNTFASSKGTARATFACGIGALLFLAFWLIYPPIGLIMSLLSLALSLIGLRLGRRARRETPSNLADAGYMLNMVGLAASAAFCLLAVAACVGLTALITTFL